MTLKNPWPGSPPLPPLKGELPETSNRRTQILVGIAVVAVVALLFVIGYKRSEVPRISTPPRVAQIAVQPTLPPAPPPTAPVQTAPSAVPTVPPATAPPTTAPPPTATYPAAQPGDQVANASGQSSAAGVQVVATGWTITTDSISQRIMCASAQIRNASGSEISYGWLNWHLQSPTGDVQQATLVTDSSTGALESGQLIPGGQVGGRICFPYPGQSGLYVASYQPNFIGGPRAVWLIRV